MKLLRCSCVPYQVTELHDHIIIKTLKQLLTITTMLEIILIYIDMVAIYQESTFRQNQQLISMRIFSGCIVKEILVYKILKSFYNLKLAGKL